MIAVPGFLLDERICYSARCGCVCHLVVRRRECFGVQRMFIVGGANTAKGAGTARCTVFDRWTRVVVDFFRACG